MSPAGHLITSLLDFRFTVDCRLDSWATCRQGEIPYSRSCYSFHPDSRAFHAAQQNCQHRGASLVEVGSQRENDMLSELLFQVLEDLLILLISIFTNPDELHDG